MASHTHGRPSLGRSSLRALLKRVVNLQREFNVLEYFATTGLEDERAAAILTNYILVVAHQNHRAMSPSDEQRIVAFLVEPGVAYCDHFVDQKTFKIDRQRQSEGQARSHARRVGFHRKIEQPPEFREVVDKGDGVGHRHVVNAGDEANVVKTAHAGVETSGEGD